MHQYLREQIVQRRVVRILSQALAQNFYRGVSPVRLGVQNAQAGSAILLIGVEPVGPVEISRGVLRSAGLRPNDPADGVKPGGFRDIAQACLNRRGGIFQIHVILLIPRRNFGCLAQV